MDFKGLQRKAKQLIDRRGGTDSLKADAEELKDIARSPGSVADKAKRAGEALKHPGAKGPDAPPAPHPPATDSPAPPAPAADVPGARSRAVRPARSRFRRNVLRRRRAARGHPEDLTTRSDARSVSSQSAYRFRVLCPAGAPQLASLLGVRLVDMLATTGPALSMRRTAVSRASWTCETR